MNLSKKTVVVGVAGGIAAFKVLDLIESLKKHKVNVEVIMTESAKQMISPALFEKASGNKVFSNLFEKDFDYKEILRNRKVDHIELADKADLFIVIPATANVIGKMSNGIADDFITTTLLAVTCPVIVCPSMNVHMWENPIVQENIKKLQHFGYHIISPESGMLACGYEGQGKLADVKKIEKTLCEFLNKSQSLKGKKILITSGGTSEPIDDVRYITNRSSGKMGRALAEAYFRKGANVLLLRSKSALGSQYPIAQEIFETGDQLQDLIKKHAEHYDICFHAAAVSDFKVQNKKKGKISSMQPISIHLVPTVKIITEIKKYNPSMKIIAFKAVWGGSYEINKKIRDFLMKEDLEAVIGNDVSKKNGGFESDFNAVTLLTKDERVKQFPRMAKPLLAEAIVDYFQSVLII